MQMYSKEIIRLEHKWNVYECIYIYIYRKVIAIAYNTNYNKIILATLISCEIKFKMAELKNQESFLSFKSRHG